MEPRQLAEVFGLDVVLADQSQILRRDQALAIGHTAAEIAAAVRRGRWIRLLPRVYLVGKGPPTPRQLVRAAWLWAGSDSLIAGAAAAWWHGFADLPPDVVDVIVPLSRSMTAQAGVRVIRSDVDPRDVARRDGIRLTSAARTCLDMVRWAQADLVEDALRLRRVSIDKLMPSLLRGRNRRGQRRASAVVTQVAATPWSKAERLAHRILHDGGITGWVANERTTTARGGVHPDIGFADVKLAVEIDSRRFHDRSSDADAWERDHEREQALVLAGWTVIRVTYRQLVERPDEVVALIRDVLQRLRSAAAR